MKSLDPPDAGSSAAPRPVAPDHPSAQDAQDDASEPWGYWVGEYGHRVYGDPVFRIGPEPCEDCRAGEPS